jgi:hypothetical protein
MSKNPLGSILEGHRVAVQISQFEFAGRGPRNFGCL